MLPELLTRQGTDVVLVCTPDRPIDDVTLKYRVMIKCKQPPTLSIMWLTVPKVVNNTFVRRGLSFATIPHARPPVLEYLLKSNSFTYHRSNGDARICGGQSSATVFYANGTAIALDRLGPLARFCFGFMPRDREYLNRTLGVSKQSLFLTKDDIHAMSSVLKRGTPVVLPPDDPNDTENLIIEDFDYALAQFFIEMLPLVGRALNLGGRLNQSVWDRMFARWLSSDHFIQYTGAQSALEEVAWSHKVVLPADQPEVIYTRPHSSWKGVLDVLSTPMSEKAGTVISLTDGTKVDGGKLIGSGKMYGPCLSKTLLFPNMIKGSRIVLQSNTVRQACPLVNKKGECTNQALRLVPARANHIPAPSGRYLWVAIMGVGGAVYEDACVISRSTANLMGTTSIVREVMSSLEPPRIPWNVGDTVNRGEPLAYVQDPTTPGVETPRLPQKVRGPLTVTDVSTRKELIEAQMVIHTTITVKAKYPCSVGSKLCGLHADKHIVSAVWKDERMPQSPGGRYADMVVSPYTLGERMAPSLLLEGMLNLVKTIGRQTLLAGGKLCDGGRSDETDALEAFVNEEQTEIEAFDTGKWSLRQAAKWLRLLGLPDTASTTMLYNRTSHPDVTFLPLFTMRLHHHPEDKLKFQNRQVTNLAGIPVQGKGNVRVTREEAEVLLAVGARGLIQEFKAAVPVTVQAQLENLRIALGGPHA